jgi:hypothetical protein
VKNETSDLAVRRLKETPNGTQDMFDELVMDESHDYTFKRYFNQAHAEIMRYIPPEYLRDTPTDLTPVFREFPDFRQDRDFNLWLIVPRGFVPNYRKSIDIKIEQFLIDYICYRWLETKSPNDAMAYFSRLEKTMRDVLSFLRRGEVVRRVSSLI